MIFKVQYFNNIRIISNFIFTKVKNILQIFFSVWQIVAIHLQKLDTSLETIRKSRGANRKLGTPNEFYFY